MGQEIRMVTTIVVSGPPLSGKTSFLRLVAEQCGSALTYGRLVTSAGPTKGWPVSTAIVDVTHNGTEWRLICAPGGVSEDSVADVAAGASFGIFVFDPQSGREEQQRDFWNAAQSTGLRWFPIVNKRDLVSQQPAELLRAYGLDGVPHCHTSFLRGPKEEAIRCFDAAIAFATL